MSVEPKKWGVIYNPKAGTRKVKKRWKEETPAQMRELIEILRNMDDFSSAPAEKVV